MDIERQLENGNSVYGLLFYNYIAFNCYCFTIIFYYLDNDSGAYNKKDNDRVDLQIEAKSIPMDSKPTKGKTRKRRLYEASGLNIEPSHKKSKMVKSTLLLLSDERQTNVPNSMKKAQQHNFLWTFDLLTNQSGDVPM